MWESSLPNVEAIPGTLSNLPAATSPYTNAITGAPQFVRLKGN